MSVNYLSDLMSLLALCVEQLKSLLLRGFWFASKGVVRLYVYRTVISSCSNFLKLLLEMERGNFLV